MSDGIIPPYMDENWREMRRHLREASESLQAAAKASTSEDVKHLSNKAHTELLHAIFIREHYIEKGEHNDDDRRPDRP
jgi:hypothetical protein